MGAGFFVVLDAEGRIRCVKLVVNIWFGRFGLNRKSGSFAPALKRVLMAQRVGDRDAGVYFDGAAVEDSGTVAPFADCGQR
jgi:hypothetical protein